MVKGLDDALNFLLVEEGGWSNNVADHGGATMYGVTQKTYDDYRIRLKKLPKQSVKLISKVEAREFYDILYWRAASCDRLPWPISYLVFDASVNSGPDKGIRWMQSGLGLTQDGQVGPKSVDAAKAVVDGGDGKSLVQILDARATFLAGLVKSDPSQLVFLLGWWRRTLRVLARSILSSNEDD